MNIPWFLTVSVVEWITLIVLSFSLFMFKIKDNLVTIVFASILLSLLSYVLRGASNLTEISTFLQLITLILIFWLMIRMPAIYAGVMATLGYVSYLFVQTLIAYILNWTNILPLEKMMGNQFLTHLVAGITVVVTLLICYFLVRFRIGFSFVPDDSSINIGLRGNIRLLIMIVLGAITIGIFLFSAKHGYLLWVFLGMCVILGLLVYFLFKKETEQ